MYQIRKGWPSNGAIDEIFEAAVGTTLAEGMICTIKDKQGTIDGDGIPCFVIGHEAARKTWVGLVTNFVVECDAEHYDTMPAAGDYVNHAAGKFTAGSKDSCVGRVLAADAATGHIRVLWF